MKRVLIANRGEIAVRIVRACRTAGIVPIAVYSEADQNAPHVRLAEEAYAIGPGPAAESYLRMDALLLAAKQAQADAIHPGYGFLSEKAEFANACEDAGIIFIGPPSSVIRCLGDKIAAKRLMQKHSVPVVPGYNEEDQSNARLAREARSIGLPLLIKAAAGGGGRGMRVVSQWEDLLPSLAEARREALAAFGDDRVLLERYVERPRHIEVQIFGDVQGNVVHLYERECSIQRRHQKIMEESPSPALTDSVRERLTQAAVRAGKAAGYINAGTVEFLLEERSHQEADFYFLEVNTRLQVEHPVTEAITGRDLVQLQFLISQGKPLPFVQEEVRVAGHAMEVRIYAEDASAGFLPSTGSLEQWIEPSGPGVRVDAGVERGGFVSPYYDPMLAKLIVHGAARSDTITRMEQALMDFHVLGVQSNIGFLLAILRHPAFQEGALSTQFLQQHFSNWKALVSIPDRVLLALAAETITASSSHGARSAVEGPAPTDPWQSSISWRNI